ncbi:uncharacterized protein L203_104865 [Cryptococcus depauperatus CBS 7841]|uniref:Uncharacterized protein n=1 Tax=Cryptococcus depauperatus CBS 7841 TaxID=1295531 RepID=A0A1E3IN34_9TREE|nr:hypothetical protein L203_01927 [Cryptococcus depauperatus CBS 7841]
MLLEKKESVLEIVKDLQKSIVAPVSTLNKPDVSKDAAANALGSIRDAINSAASSIPTTSAPDARAVIDRGVQGGVDELSKLTKRDDLQQVGEVLAKVIEDVVKTVEQLADDLKGLPLIGAIIASIDGGLHTLLLGIEIVLKGVIQILQGLLSGISDLLSQFGKGLLAGVILG